MSGPEVPPPAGDVVTVLHADGTVRAASSPLRLAAGDSLFAVVHPEDHRPLQDALAALAARPGTAGPLAVRLTADGGWSHGTALLTSLVGEPALHGAVVVAHRPTAPTAPVTDHAPLAAALGEALDRGQLRLVYQPKVEILTGRIAGVEALLRWDDPELGPVSPAEFIPVAEATGLIVPIGAWVIAEACRDGARWQREFPRTPPLTVQVNASAHQFRTGLVEIVRAAVESADIEPTTVLLEVTESTVMDDVESAIGILRALKVLGLGVSIDDFGTGYSSLQYLRRLPLDEVKIDRSFVANLATDPEDTAIVAAVISMSHALDREVVAEGVETVEQLEKLRALGCELAQGYLLARPMTPAAVATLLTADAAGERLTGAGRPRVSGCESVVVADDAAEVRQLARMSLAAAGFAVEEAVDGETAFYLVRRSGAACVVLDMFMPGGPGGVEICRRLRADPATAGCTVVMLTASDSAHDKAAAFSAGADEYVVKPFVPRDLVTRVRAAVARRHGPGR